MWNLKMSNIFQTIFDQLVTRLNLLDERLVTLETHEGEYQVGDVRSTQFVINNVTILAGNSYTTSDLRGVDDIPLDARGIWLYIQGDPTNTGDELRIVRGDRTADQYSSKLHGDVVGTDSGMIMVGLSGAGTIKLTAVGGDWTAIYALVEGWYR